MVKSQINNVVINGKTENIAPIVNYIKTVHIKTKLSEVNVLKLQQKKAKYLKKYIIVLRNGDITRAKLLISNAIRIGAKIRSINIQKRFLQRHPID